MMNVAPGSDRKMVCSPEFCPHDAALHGKRDRHGTVRRADQLVSGSLICATAHPVCPPCLQTICLQKCCQRHCDVPTHEFCHRERVQECTSRQGRAAGLPRSLSLMLMSRRKVKNALHDGLGMPTVDVSLSPTPLARTSDRTGVRMPPPCSQPLAATILFGSRPGPP